MIRTALRGLVSAIFLQVLLVAFGSGAAQASGTVNVLVKGPHGLYRVYLYHEGGYVGAREGVMQYGGFNNFAFSGCQSGHAYWAKAVRVADGMTRLGGGSVYLWWYQFSIRLPDIAFPGSLSAESVAPRGPASPQAQAQEPEPAANQGTTEPATEVRPTWGSLKSKYRNDKK
jgi:hypothetical protein